MKKKLFDARKELFTKLMDQDDIKLATRLWANTFCILYRERKLEKAKRLLQKAATRDTAIFTDIEVSEFARELNHVQ